MAEIVNLRDFRKKKEREEKAETSARNRALAGRTSGEKVRDRDTAERTKSDLDKKKLEGSDSIDDPDTSGEEA